MAWLLQLREEREIAWLHLWRRLLWKMLEGEKLIKFIEYHNPGKKND